MSRETSEEVGKPYGLERVCRILEYPRSTIYAQQASAKVMTLFPPRRGAKPKLSDIDLLAAIRADLDTSPFTGEGHRKVWARLRIQRTLRVSRARVLRLIPAVAPSPVPGRSQPARRNDYHRSSERHVGHRRHPHRDGGRGSGVGVLGG